MAYGCRIPLFKWQQEHHILVGASNPLFGVGGHIHVQLEGYCTCLVVLFAVRQGVEEWSKPQPRRLRIPPIDLIARAFLGR
jgi:hypothetical protein